MQGHVIHDVVEPNQSPAPIRRRIGDLFVEHGMITDQQLAEALDVQRRTGGRLGEILIELEFITSVDAAQILAERLGMPFVNLDATPVDEIVAQRIPEEIARRYRAIPIEEQDGVLRIAVADPTDVFALDDLQVITHRQVVPVVADPGQLLETANRIWTRPSMESRIDDATDAEDDEPSHLLVSDAEDAPIIRLVDAMIGQATDERASDIHIEPSGDKRADPLPGRRRAARRVVHAPERAAARRQPAQGDGRLRHLEQPHAAGRAVLGARSRDRHVDVRLTTLPTVARRGGGAATARQVARHLRPRRARLRGRRARRATERVPRVAGRDHLPPVRPVPARRRRSTRRSRELNDPGRAIVTRRGPDRVPPRRHQAGPGRAPRSGSSFAGALRAILRADPDVILIGEVRDRETALIAAEAALTGHLVRQHRPHAQRRRPCRCASSRWGSSPTWSRRHCGASSASGSPAGSASTATRSRHRPRTSSTFLSIPGEDPIDRVAGRSGAGRAATPGTGAASRSTR